MSKAQETLLAENFAHVIVMLAGDEAGIEHLAKIPTIVLDPKVTHTSRLARVHITTAATGISAPGTVYRMDEIPLPLRPALDSPYPTDEDVIRRILQAVATKPGWSASPESRMATTQANLELRL